jgi:Cof subfamily protein (haloacid dehalogenase superfamily)
VGQDATGAMSATEQSPRIGLIALDVDGTLLDSRHRVTEAVRRSIQAVAEAGVNVALASARGPSGLRPIAQQLGIAGYAVAFSGALLCRLGSSPPAEVLGGRRMELGPARLVARRARELGISVGWWDLEHWSVPELDGPSTLEASIIEVEPRVEDLATLDHPPFKLQCMVSADAIERLMALRAELPPGCAGQFSNPNYFEVFSPGTDKAHAVLELGALLGCTPREIAAIGDGENDLAMLSAVGLGVAVANARPAVRVAAAWVTTSNDEDGVAVALERMRREGRF